MTIEDLRKFRNLEPFHPFYVHLAGGRKLLVRNPENIGFSDKSRLVSVFENASACDMIDLRQIISVTSAKAVSKKNGRRLHNGKH